MTEETTASYKEVLFTLMDHINQPYKTGEETVRIKIGELQLLLGKLSEPVIDKINIKKQTYNDYIVATGELKTIWLKTRNISDLRNWLQVKFPIIE